MAKVTRSAPTDNDARQARIDALRSLGLHERQRVRFRRDPAARWTEGEATSVEADGSLGLRDTRGRRRSIPLEAIEVLTRGPRGGRVWTPLTRIAADDEQLGLFG